MQIASQIFPIYQIEHDCYLSAWGDITIAYEIILPEVFTQYGPDYEALHQARIRAMRVFDPHTIIHQKDIYRRKAYAAQPAAETFLARAAARHFNGRPYLDHRCYLLVTKKAADRQPASSGFSGLMRRRIVPRQAIDEALLLRFLEKAGQFARILSDSGLMTVKRLDNADLTGLLERYVFQLDTGEQALIRDVHLKDHLQVGDRYGQVFTLGDADDLPGFCGSRIDYDKYSTDQTRFPVGFAAKLNLLLDLDHEYNQFIFIGDAPRRLKELELKKRRLRSLAAYSRENAIACEATHDFLNEAMGQGRLPVRAHFNVTAWTTDRGALQEVKNQVASAMAGMGAVAKQETEGFAQLWWAGIPGNAADFPMNDSFDTFLEHAVCFLNAETHYRSDDPATGFRFCDRFSRPVYVDLYDAVRHAGLTSNMGTLVTGTSGGGKSVTVNHLLETLHTQGAHCVVIDIGGSYKSSCELLGGYYFTYAEDQPIRFNPFHFTGNLDTEKKESLKSLLVTLWKDEKEDLFRSEYVALSNALQGYYETEVPFRCFDSFYEYLQNDFRQEVHAEDFNLRNFLYVLRPYYRGGEFDYLLNATENLDLLHQPFVVVDLDEIKDHPILFPVVTLIIMEMFISKMRKLKGVRKVLCIDEAWKAISKSGMAAFVQYAFKTIRKFNGVPLVISQEVDDLIGSEIIRDAIVNNTDIKILMDMRKFLHKFDKVQDALGLSEKAKTILLSVNKDEREIYIDIGGQVCKVFRNELCPEELLAFSTEGQQRVKVREVADRYGSMEAGITALVNQQKKSS
ncbi:MAG TPA: TraG family conjugative transposon ATPase [Mucilaginibacter sp.]|nr:TraG family conjugative transposon ATPase [Mucilaginibacter sp.]